MSWLDDLVDAGGQIADKVLDFKIADANIGINEAQASQPGTAPVTAVERSALAPPADFARWLPWIAAGGGALLLVLALRR